ncbi:hypothetical protein BKA82DRAFT_4357728 [Pisolithus tinctorius]|nr:hypothetical protein BKA82DRAFT_4357728 [Pisolithus tinctorius]
MSGDESDHLPGLKRYAITRLNWRSQMATDWLRVFDLIHLSTRFNANGRAKHGAFPHTRVPSRRVESAGAAVPGLPSNFYDSTWLLNLDDDDKVRLNILPEVDLSHTEAVLRVAEKFKGMKGRKLASSEALSHPIATLRYHQSFLTPSQRFLVKAMLEPPSPRTFFAKTPRRSGVSLERDVGSPYLEAGISHPPPAFQAASFLLEHHKLSSIYYSKPSWIVKAFAHELLCFTIS